MGKNYKSKLKPMIMAAHINKYAQGSEVVGGRAQIWLQSSYWFQLKSVGLFIWINVSAYIGYDYSVRTTGKDYFHIPPVKK